MPILDKARHALEWTRESVRARGLLTTLKVAVSAIEDSAFDRRFGTETSVVVDSDRLDPALENRAHAVRYKATKARPFSALLRRLPLPDRSTFVDVGSGKGKVLLLAAQHPFARVIGIEFSRPLCEQARRNIEIFRQRVAGLAPIEVVEADVATHAFRGDENVFFLYNPFDAVMLGKFVGNLQRSLASHPRAIWLIYSTPLYAEVLEGSGLFGRSEAVSLRGTEFHVYTNADAGGRATSSRSTSG